MDTVTLTNQQPISEPWPMNTSPLSHPRQIRACKDLDGWGFRPINVNISITENGVTKVIKWDNNESTLILGVPDHSDAEQYKDVHEWVNTFTVELMKAIWTLRPDEFEIVELSDVPGFSHAVRIWWD